MSFHKKSIKLLIKNEVYLPLYSYQDWLIKLQRDLQDISLGLRPLASEITLSIGHHLFLLIYHNGTFAQSEEFCTEMIERLYAVYLRTQNSLFLEALFQPVLNLIKLKRKQGTLAGSERQINDLLKKMKRGEVLEIQNHKFSKNLLSAEKKENFIRALLREKLKCVPGNYKKKKIKDLSFAEKEISPDIYALSTEAKILLLFRQEKYQECFDLCFWALDYFQDHKNIFIFHLGEILQEIGLTKEALILWSKFMSHSFVGKNKKIKLKMKMSELDMLFNLSQILYQKEKFAESLFISRNLLEFYQKQNDEFNFLKILKERRQKGILNDELEGQFQQIWPTTGYKHLTQMKGRDLYEQEEKELPKSFFSTKFISVYLKESIAKDGLIPLVTWNWLLDWYFKSYTPTIMAKAHQHLLISPLYPCYLSEKEDHQLSYLLPEMNKSSLNLMMAKVYIKVYIHFFEMFFQELYKSTLGTQCLLSQEVHHRESTLPCLA